MRLKIITMSSAGVNDEKIKYFGASLKSDTRESTSEYSIFIVEDK
tara:strand:+ start:652 stop:786 length:135 start_codon:yes stop_codon:yes gene_type:complete